VEPLPDRLTDALARPGAYPGDPSAAAGVRWVQTHLSHVFLTGTRVYKLRKAVDLGFLDFSSRTERNADCAREVLLNRRLAPDVYLGIAPVVPGRDGFRVGELVPEVGVAALAREPGEHVVVMRRLPDGCDALSLLEAGRLRAAHVDAVARVLARFHAAHGLGTPSPFPATVWRERIEHPVRENLELLAPAAGRLVPRATWARTRRNAAAFAELHAADFEARRLAGRAVDGHGDVHLQHVWFEPGREEPLLVDCLEFRDDLRQIDAAADVAFLAMDLAYRHRPRLAGRFLRVYAAASDDYELYRVVDYFVSYRAAVRAKVAALAADDPGIAPAQRQAAAGSARRHLALAARALAPRRHGALVLMAGLVGTGKSSAAEVLADAVDGVVIASDRVRKRRAGLPATDRSGAAAGLYRPEATDAVYAALLERAAPVAAAGRVAILDATYSRARHREQALAWALERRLPVALVETLCARETALARLARRAARNSSASDAGPTLYDWSASRFEPVRPAPGLRRHRVATDAEGWRRRLRAIGRELRRAPRPTPEAPEEREHLPCRIEPSRI
jgi:aminoglycoside phosphotransferase family enzyme/predicted kinase